MKRYWQCQKCGKLFGTKGTSPLMCTVPLAYKTICGGHLKEMVKKEYVKVNDKKL